jgi:DNA-binding GntR family transcriptional regulator
MSASPHTHISNTIEALSRRLEAKTGLADEIADTIRGLILSGELKPGDRVVESRIARQLGVGQPTVRESLVALEHQGLVSRKPNHGCCVTTFTRSEISDILRIRSELETLAVELAIENAPDKAIHELIEIGHDMVQIAESGDASLFHSRDRVWHESLWNCSGNSFLPRVLSQVMQPLLAFLFIRNVRDSGLIDLVCSARAHVEIAESLLTRDKTKARRVATHAFAMFAEQHLHAMDGKTSRTHIR